MSLMTMVATKRNSSNIIVAGTGGGSSVTTTPLASPASTSMGQTETSVPTSAKVGVINSASPLTSSPHLRPIKIEAKYSEAERVLCYEPDPKKVRVVYDAKILQVAEDLDSRGKLRGHQYKVHFQGWNSSWDRYVGEDFLLKDTPDNREHQRVLALEAEQARLTKQKKKKKKSKKSRSEESFADASMTSSSDQPEVAPMTSSSPKKKKKKKKSKEDRERGEPKIAKILIVNGSITSTSSSSSSTATSPRPTTSASRLPSSSSSSSTKPLIPLPVLRIKSPKAGVLPTLEIKTEPCLSAPTAATTTGTSSIRRRKRNLSADSSKTPVTAADIKNGGSSTFKKFPVKKRARLVQQNLEDELVSASPVPPASSKLPRSDVPSSNPMAGDAVTSSTRKRETSGGLPSITLTENLRRKLTEDFESVCKRRRLTLLPAVPSIASVLEDFVRHYSSGRLVAYEKQQRKSLYTGYKRGDNAELTYQRALEAIQMCKEVAEGLRILIDFNLQRSLLYQNEVSQFETIMNSEDILSRIFKPDSIVLKQAISNLEMTVNGNTHSTEDTPSLKQQGLIRTVKKFDVLSPSSQTDLCEATVTSSGGLGKRHRPHHLSSRRTSCETSCLGAPSTTLSSAASNKEGSSCSTNSRSTATNRTSLLMPPAASNPSTPAANKVMRSIESWRLVPVTVYSQAPPLPSIVYGPIHLLRLFVKMPEILGRMQLSPKTSKLLIKYMDTVLEYLDGRPDLFSPEMYNQ